MCYMVPMVHIHNNRREELEEAFGGHLGNSDFLCGWKVGLTALFLLVSH